MRLSCTGKWWCCCLKKSKKDFYIIETNEKIGQEFYIGSMIRRLRTLQGLLKERCSKDEWQSAQDKFALHKIGNLRQSEIEKEFAGE